MLFWIFVIVLVVCIAYNVKANYDSFAVFMITTVAAICVIVSGIIFLDMYGNIEGKIAQNNQKYESLTYQLENNLYDNDNDLGKKELYNQISEWNEDVVYYQNVQDNFWFGIYYPNVFDQFKLIDYGQMKE